MLSDNKMRVLSAFAVALMLAAAVVPAVAQEASAANQSGTVNIQPGQTWSWTPTFPSGLSPTLKVCGNTSSMPADSASFAATSGNAKIQSGKVVVTIPADYTGSNYYVKVQAKVSQPSQTAYYEITFNVATFTLSYSADTVVAKVGTKIADLTPTVGGGVTAKSYAISGTLPAGLTFSTSTGKITGTPTAYKAQTNYTITATLNTTPVQTVSKTVSIGAFTNISASNYTVYAISGVTSVSVPGVSMPTGTVLQSMTATATKDGTAISGFKVGTATSGLTVTANTGKVTGTPSAVGTFVFTETYTATAATGGSTATRTVTVVSDRNVSGASFSADDGHLYSYAGHRDTLHVLNDSGLTVSDVSVAIRSVSVDGIVIYHSGESQSQTYQMFTAQNPDPNAMAPYDEVGSHIKNSQDGYWYNPVTEETGTLAADPANMAAYIGLGSGSNGDVLVTGADLPAGEYTVVIRIATLTSGSTTSGATGSSPSSNYQDITVYVTNKCVATFDKVDSSDPTKYGATFYMATNKVYDALTVKAATGEGSSSFTFAINSYGDGITSSNITVSSAGAVQPGSAAVTTAGSYSVVLKVQDPDSSGNSATITLPVVVKNALTFTNGTSAGAITS